MRNRLLAGISILVVLLLLGGFVIWQGRGTTEATASPTPQQPESAATETPAVRNATTASATTPAGASSGSGSATPSSPAAAVPAGCMPTLTEIEATSFAIDQMKVKAPMISLGEDESGAAAAPPKDASHTVGWWKNGPKVGSRQGHAILTIHTYQNGKALGNELHDQKNGFKDGDLVRMTDARGNTQCYTLERSMKLWVKDYDPNSDVLYNFTGEPRAVIVICWDYDVMGKEWDSRILYYLKPVAPVR
ncbi:class F sortase [Tessaracoccus sp. SD287]|uniref:class F sortase n=1 Tax=Tessaracoccus sp. SD287 TaxID=2782008 RepID=UPI001F607AA9|nr:class F sortase [Tessaracoccus sp. SD287]